MGLVNIGDRPLFSKQMDRYRSQIERCLAVSQRGTVHAPRHSGIEGELADPIHGRRYPYNGKGGEPPLDRSLERGSSHTQLNLMAHLSGVVPSASARPVTTGSASRPVHAEPAGTVSGHMVAYSQVRRCQLEISI